MKQNSSKIDANIEIRKKLARLAIFTVAGVLFIDQASKIWVKTQMYLDESISVFGDWFFIHFIENPGMAFGFEFGGEMGKLALSLFRIVAIVFIAIYLRKLIKQEANRGLIICVSLVLAGAAGNIIDSAFYGVIFSESPPFSPQTALMFPPDGGYSSFLHGHVVDMLYFPIIDTYWPSWLPLVGGDRLQFFRPIFNIADSAISVGMILILFNQKRFFASEEKIGEVAESESEEGVKV
ncbi:lipoprotein signal peptidase [Cryomorpha ignava]|uniref:lipoprotein signal peptidase n=1 Tax=Cryomorpha ignava TaxID=101383 RepID=UPI001EF9B1C0|nr:lipoprotein signal peptidase [Cryomorpha ignava]